MQMEMNKEAREVTMEALRWGQWQKGAVSTADKTVTVILARWVQRWGVRDVKSA